MCFSVVQGFFFEGRRPKIGPFNSVSVLKLIQPSKKEKNVLDRLESFEIVLGRSGHFGPFKVTRGQFESLSATSALKRVSN